jgi:two-component system, cell cycle response regulator
MSSLTPQRILLIEDDRVQYSVLRGFVSQFRTGPWELEWVDNYAAGLKKLLGSRYAVCLLDYQLGDRDGLELLREARAAACPTPVVLLTAEDSSEVDEAAMDAGAMGYLVKGEVTPRMLEHSIRYARKLGDTMGRLQQMATRDALTGLHNRREFDRILEEELQRSTRFERPFALVLVDIDFFKRINDTHGHQIGDEVLKHVSSLLAGQVRIVDRVARYGGEEFAIVMIETDRKQAVDGMQRLAALLEEMPCVVPGKNLTIPVTLSGGIAVCPEDGVTTQQLIDAADKALYAAKKAGRNRIFTARKTLPVRA